MTTQLKREEILGAYASVATAPADWWHTAQAAAATDEGETSQWWSGVTLRLSPWLVVVVVIGVLVGLVAALVWLYALPVELNRVGLWQPPVEARHTPPATELAAPNALQAEAEALPPALTSRPTETRETIYAQAPTLTVWCDGRQRELVSAGQVDPARRAGCFAAYGWCVECQAAWARAHP